MRYETSLYASMCSSFQTSFRLWMTSLLLTAGNYRAMRVSELSLDTDLPVELPNLTETAYRQLWLCLNDLARTLSSTSFFTARKA